LPQRRGHRRQRRPRRGPAGPAPPASPLSRPPPVAKAPRAVPARRITDAAMLQATGRTPSVTARASASSAELFATVYAGHGRPAELCGPIGWPRSATGFGSGKKWWPCRGQRPGAHAGPGRPARWGRHSSAEHRAIKPRYNPPAYRSAVQNRRLQCARRR
jgi:hypothetical protein